MPAFDISLEADEDLQGIVAYTAERWGVDQVRIYMTGLEQKMEQMATGIAHTKSLDHLMEGLELCRYEHHYIFALHRPDKAMAILAVFHEKMNLMERLKRRL